MNYGYHLITKTLLCLALFITLSGAWGLADTNLIAYYKFNESSGNEPDYFGYDQNLTANGTSIGTTSGIISNARGVFPNDGNYFYKTGFYTDFNSQNPFTYAGWIKRNAFGVGPDQQTILNVSSGGSNIHRIYINRDTNQFCATVAGGEVCKTITNLNWNFFAARYLNGDVYLWVNDSNINNAVGSHPAITLGSAQIQIGKWIAGAGYYASNTYVDEFSIWARALTETDVNDLYNNGLGVSYPFPQNTYRTFNVYRKGTSTDLTGITADWNDNTYDVSGQASPFTQQINNGSYDANFSRNGYDSNTIQVVVADNNETLTVYLSDTTAPTTSISGNGTTFTTQTITLSCSDAGSGCATTKYMFDNNGQWYTYTAPFTISTYGTTEIDYNSSDVAGNQEAIKTAYAIIYEPFQPIIDFNYDYNMGFADSNVLLSLTCTVASANALYDINAVDDGNNFNILESYDTNNLTKTTTHILNSGATSFTASCEDDFNNISTATLAAIYDINIQLINEATGEFITYQELDQNFNVARAYSTDGNYLYNFKDSNKLSIGAIFPAGLQIMFEFQYPNKTEGSTIYTYTPVNRYIEPDVVNDSNVRVCAPVQETVATNIFTSNQQRQIVVENKVSQCYDVAASALYAYGTGYGFVIYLINKPYYVYYYLDGVKTVLALINGGTAAEYNLDTIIFARTTSSLSINLDGIAITPLINSVTGEYDTNTVQIYYQNIYNDNTSLQLDVYNGSTLIWTYLDTNTPNEVLVTFPWGTIPGITVDNNNLKLIVTATTATTTKTSTTYFGLFGGIVDAPGASPKLHIFLAIASLLLFFFGITIVAASRVFGYWGVLMCIIAIIICAYGIQTWYIQLLEAGYLTILFFFILMGKQGQAFTGVQ